jgi:hypothetical protein
MIITVFSLAESGRWMRSKGLSSFIKGKNVVFLEYAKEAIIDY